MPKIDPQKTKRTPATLGDVKKPLLVRDPVGENDTISHIFVFLFLASMYGAYWLANFLHATSPAGQRVKPGAAAPSPSAATGGSSSSSIGSDDHCAPYDLGSIPDYLIGSVPFFFFLFLAEFALLRLGGIHSSAGQYTAVDCWSSICMGITQLIWLEVFLRVVKVRSLYCQIWTKLHPFTLPETWWGYVIAFILDDLMYYWFHRFAHVCGAIWAGHAIHHSSERFNLSTAVRQSYIQGFMGPIVGFLMAPFVPPKLHWSCNQWVTLYQFWIHTPVIRKINIPGFEFIFNTPSHHRVHHDRRVHKNFAGVFILFDRIFGTFRDERECDTDDKGTLPDDELVLFGIQDEVKSWTEAPMQVQWLVDHGLRHPKNLIVGPGFYTATVERRLPAVSDAPRFRQDDGPRGMLTNMYLYSAFLLSLATAVWIMKLGAPATVSAAFLQTLVVCVGMYVQGLVCDRSYKLALMIEAARFVFAVFAGPAVVPPYTAALALLSLVWIAAIWGDSPVRPVKKITLWSDM